MNIVKPLTNDFYRQHAECINLNVKTDPISPLLSKPPTLLQKISNLAGFLFKTAISFFLYWTNPSLFSLGFIVGIIGDEQCKKAIEKIKIVWHSQPWSMCILGITASILSLPVTLGGGSFLCGAYLGSSISKQAQKIISMKKDQHPANEHPIYPVNPISLPHDYTQTA